MSGFSNFLTKSLKDAAEDLVKSKLSGFKSGDKKEGDNDMNPYPSGQPQQYGGYQGSQIIGGMPQPQQYGGGYGQQQPYGMNPQMTGGYGQQGQPSPYGPSGGMNTSLSFDGVMGPSMSMGAHGGMQMPGQGYNQSHYAGQMPPQSVPMTFGNPSIKYYPNCNPTADADVLRKAMKGFGCNNSRVIDVICKRTNFQRLQIVRSFQQMYGKDLINELKSELYGDFEDLIIALMTPSANYDASEIRRAIEGIGTNENILIEIMCSRTNAQIHDIKAAYKYLYGIDLESDIRGDTSGYFKRLLIALSTGYRDESNYTDINNAHQSAKSLYNAGEGRLGTDEAAFLGVLCSQNFAQLNLVFQEYHKITGRTLDIAIKNEFSGDIKEALLALYQIVVNRPGYFASQLERSMKGFGTRDKDLIRLVVSRCEIDMADIRNEFQKIYGRSLEDTITGDTSGSYKTALITLVKGN